MNLSANHLAPLSHPRRDPYLRRARLCAAMTCAAVNGLMLAVMLYRIEAMRALTPALGGLFLLAMLLVGTRVPLLVELFLGAADRAEELENAPPLREIIARTFVAVLAPWALVILAMHHADDEAFALLCVFGIALAELVYRFAGFRRWRTPLLSTDVLREVYFGTAMRAAEIMAAEEPRKLDSRAFEAQALLVSGRAIKDRSPRAVELLMQSAEGWMTQASPEERDRVQRMVPVLAADLARLESPSGAAATEAAALRVLPAGHPRRLAYALFVATAALDADQPEAAVKALSRLHSRDVAPPTARLVVDWLLAQAARRMGNEDLANSCEAALRTFDRRRVARLISLEELSSEEADDPYSKWIRRARAELMEQG